MVRLIIQLGSSNDCTGRLDADAGVRALRVKELCDKATSGGETVFVLASGGADSETFNPTLLPHYSYVSEALLAVGVPKEALIQPGLAAMHTVDEALMARQFVQGLARRSDEELSVVAVTSDFHAARARHLFGVAFGAHASLDVPVSVEEVPSPLEPDALRARVLHEKAALDTLRKAPYGTWLGFVREHGLEACNRSLRHSRRLRPAPSSSSSSDTAPSAPPAVGPANGVGCTEMAATELPALRLARGALCELLLSVCEQTLNLAREGALSSAQASSLISGDLLPRETHAALGQALATDRRLVLTMLRQLYTRRVSWAIFTTEWQDCLAHFLVHTLGRRQVLEVCAGNGVLMQPMRRRGIEWTCTDHAAPAEAVAPLQVRDALDAMMARPPEAVFFSWWIGEETDQDYLLLLRCWEAAIPLIFVGEGEGGCTGSSMFWRSGAPIVPLKDAMAALGTRGGPPFEDVPQWDGCFDRTWCVWSGIPVPRSRSEE